MHKKIKAIETEYAGCRFRSRLEARWAVFFDALKIEWEYEPEGFETSAGWYLPDFRIQILRDLFAGSRGTPIWFEVKREDAPEDPRHQALAHESDVPVLVAREMPRDSGSQRQHLTALSPLDPFDGTRFIEPRPVAIGVVFRMPGEPSTFLDWGIRHRSRTIDDAYKAARSARFEFGEVGR